MAYYKNNEGVENRNLGEWDFKVGITFPAGTDLSGEAVSCRYEAPDGTVANGTAIVSTVNVYHTVASGEIDAVGYWWYWFFVGTDEIYGPVGILVGDVPAVTV